MKYYTVYETRNLDTGQYYRGRHITTDPDDSYLGSGILITNAINAHGTSRFKKQVLFLAFDEESLDWAEKLLVITRDEDPLSYNLAKGGQGGCIALFKSNPDYDSICKKISTVARSQSAKRSEHAKQGHASKAIGMYGRKQSDKQKAAASAAIKGKPKSPEAIEKARQSAKITRSKPGYVHPNSKKHSITTCPHCGRSGGRNGMTRCHFDNCKSKPSMSEHSEP